MNVIKTEVCSFHQERIFKFKHNKPIQFGLNEIRTLLAKIWFHNRYKNQHAKRPKCIPRKPQDAEKRHQSL